MSTQYNGIDSNIIIPGTINIASSTNASPIAINTSGAHGLTTGDTVQINGHQTNTNANGRYIVTVTSGTQVTLNGSTGNGVGGATGTIQSMGDGATYQIPSDGDPLTAASVNVALETLGDRTAHLAANIGPYKPIGFVASQTNDNATEATTWATHTFAAQNTWESIASPLVTQTNTFQGGAAVFDVLDVEFTASCSWADAGSTGLGFMLSLYVSFYAPGNAPAVWTKIPGSGVVVPSAVGNSSAQYTGVVVRGRQSVNYAIGIQNVQVALYGYTRNATPANVSCSFKGDYQTLLTIYRATDFSGRVA